MEPLWHSARFACPGTRISPPKESSQRKGRHSGALFFKIEKLGVRGCSISRCSRSSQGDATFCPLWHSAIYPDPTFLKNPDFWKTVSGSKLSQQSIWLGPVARGEILLKNAGQYSPQMSLRQRGATFGAPLALCEIYVSGNAHVPTKKSSQRKGRYSRALFLRLKIRSPGMLDFTASR